MSTFSTGDRTSTSMPGTSSQLIPGPLQTYTPPELAIGNVTSLKKSLTGPPAKKSPAAASNPGAKVSNKSSIITSAGFFGKIVCVSGRTMQLLYGIVYNIYICSICIIEYNI